jgi:TatD DNase family protein
VYELIDTHCHLTTLPEEELPDVFARAKEHNVNRFVCIGAGVGEDSAAAALKLASAHKDIWVVIGIHPHDAKLATTLDGIASLAADPKVVGIGETGLDFFRDWSPKENQYALFRNTIAFAKEQRKPLVIHCRDAAEETIAVLKECNAETVGGVFHCYAQDAEFAKRLADINFIVSFTGNITFKKADALRDAVRRIPLTQMMLETDMPYMAPEPFRGKPSEPRHVQNVAYRVADIKGVPIEEVARITTQTANTFFRLGLA